MIRCRIGGPQLETLLRDLRCSAPIDLANPTLGAPVTTADSSWVRLLRSGTGNYYCKTYVYRSLWRRLRGLARNTAPWRASRAAREAAALTWLTGHGLPAPRVVGLVEERRCGLLATAVLVTDAWPGTPLDRLLPASPPEQQRRLARALGAFIARLHSLGFRDRNLDLRNLLAHEHADGSIAIAKIDSGRHVLVRPGARDDRLARADWARLLPQLLPFDLAATVRAAAAEHIAT